MDKEKVLKDLEEIFRAVLNNQDISLKPEYTANDVDGWDSITNLYIVDGIESKFNIKLSLDDILLSRDINDLCDVIIAKTK
jgi:acyl carrier protein